MKPLLFIIFLLPVFVSVSAEPKTIHVFVALCDNKYQGIVPVPENLGNGQNPKTNLYWGAAYGIKTFFRYKAEDWKLIQSIKQESPIILESILFKHRTEDIYLLADAYDGEFIDSCILNFLNSANQNFECTVNSDTILHFGGSSDLVVYVGHNGLMDFDIEANFNHMNYESNDIMILACYSKQYFKPFINMAEANPVLWTNHLMAPEAYTLKAAIDGWIKNESGEQIKERAAQAYNQYQKCGIRGARNLFSSGF
ncbi:hypothetical protein [Saccharicrinis sp. FJH54]|uniref:hypothetical protein n=1 Tax=Saccharicrinis sp. FJH54 TaxID=3344665 RepID=UPI0035D40862